MSDGNARAEQIDVGAAPDCRSIYEAAGREGARVLYLQFVATAMTVDFRGFTVLCYAMLCYARECFFVLFRSKAAALIHSSLVGQRGERERESDHMGANNIAPSDGRLIRSNLACLCFESGSGMWVYTCRCVRSVYRGCLYAHLGTQQRCLIGFLACLLKRPQRKRRQAILQVRTVLRSNSIDVPFVGLVSRPGDWYRHICLIRVARYKDNKDGTVVRQQAEA